MESIPPWVTGSMQTLRFDELRRELEAAGSAPPVVARIIAELKDHLADSEAAALASGASQAEARRQALEILGTSSAIAQAVAARPQLLDWRHRWPQSAQCVDSLTYCLAVPVVPFVYCLLHPASIVRWGLSSSLAACVTGLLLFTMQLVIV